MAVPAPHDLRRATRALWSFLAKPYTPEEAAQCVTGMPPSLTRQVVAVALATSPEAATLLAAMPQTLRALAIVTHDEPVRGVGEVRGPILWGETVAARSGTAGRTDVFVCASPIRAYDSPENRVLAAALAVVARSARRGDSLAKLMGGPPLAARLRDTGSRSRHFLDHRTLTGVMGERADARAVARARKGPKKATYRPAVAMLERARNPLLIDDLLPFVDPRTARQHDVLLAIAERLQEAGMPLPEPSPTPHGHLAMGPVLFRHASVAAGSEPAGIIGPGIVVDVPDPLDHVDLAKAAADLARWNRGVETVLVACEADIDAAAERLAAALARAA
ncbi:MAG: hypothetical protein HYX34_01660 [Actinobacteria bacterium]|nr:hypothetical protein [Actinomycetota bacterium]